MREVDLHREKPIKKFESPFRGRSRAGRVKSQLATMPPNQDMMKTISTSFQDEETTMMS